MDNTINWEILREEGLKYLQTMTGHIWTDYNVHDPGVTIFETLCFAITDLETRLSLPIDNILTDNSQEGTRQQFFSPREILTVNPVTINDYRKLLIDIPGVKNAWLTPAIDTKPTLYYDKDNNALVYDYATGSQKVTLNGLYRVYIERDEDIKDENIVYLQDNEAFTRKVKEILHNHRNICEEFVKINIMEQETISLFSDIRIDEDADADEVMAKIYFDLESFISPRIKQYSLKKMFQKGKSIEEIFNGPQLENGFIDDDELGSGEKRRELHTSDLLRIIMAHEEVKDVKNLFISNKPHPELTEKKEWALVLDDTKALLLEDFNSTRIRVFKDETMCPVSANQVTDKVEKLKEQSRTEIFDDPAMDIEESLGEYSNLTAYDPLAYKLPANFGISETGLPSAANDRRRAQAKQLRAYLLFFEQILINYLKQLDSFKDIFSFRQNKEDILKTYFSQLPPESIWKEDFPEIEEGYEFIEDDQNEGIHANENAFIRKNRILNHLLAQFNEKFADYALFGYKYNMLIDLDPEEKKPYFLKAKADFLENYPRLSRNRNRAYNYFAEDVGGYNINGLKDILSSKLGLDVYIKNSADKNEQDNFHILEHILLRPDGFLPLEFICSEKIEEDYQPDPYSYKLTFIIPKKAGRFGNSKFKELVYNTIETETPAYISYTIREFDSDQMSLFTDTYHNFLHELRNSAQDNSDNYNPYRNKLIELLHIGRVKLPVLHLDAYNIAGDDKCPDNETPITLWKDLSRNNNDAMHEAGSEPRFITIEKSGHAFLRFENGAQLKIKKSILHDDFTIVIIYKAGESNNGEEQNNLVAGADPNKDNFGLSFNGKGDLTTRINNDTITIESTSEIPHMAILTRDKETGTLNLFIDGVLHNSRILVNADISFNQESLIIGPGAGITATCHIGEIIMLDSVLSGSRKEKLEEHLSSKWGIALSSVSSIEKPSLHLDASDARSVIRNEKTNTVEQWNDLSLQGISSIQNTVSLQPEYIVDGINGLPVIRFNNTSLTIPNSGEHRLFEGDFTIAFVYKADKEEGRLIDGTVTEPDDGKKSYYISIEKKGDILVCAEDEQISISADEQISISATVGDPHIAIISGKVVGSELKMTIYRDGKSFNSTTFSDSEAFSKGPDNLLIGQSRTREYDFIGDIGEIVIYNNALSIWKRQRLEEYLSIKWNIDISGINYIATPVLHLDASRQASVMDEEGPIIDKDSRVSQWVDLSYYGNNALQQSIYRRPAYTVDGINGLGAVTFTQEKINDSDFYEDSLNINRIIQDDFTIMVVFKPDVNFYLRQDSLGQDSDLDLNVNESTKWTEGAALIDADCSGLYNDFGLSIGQSEGKMVVMGGIGDRLTEDHTIKTRDLNFDNTHMIIFTRLKSTGEVKIYADGLLHAEADLRDGVILNDSRTIKIGAFNSEGIPFHGSIGEIILFDTHLTEGKRQQIEKYLSTKWRVPLTSLPIDITHCSLHLDAADTKSITKDSDNRVSEWYDVNDISEVVALQQILESQPLYSGESINGMAGIRFNNSFMNVTPDTTSYDDFTIAIVYKALSPGNIHPDWEYGAGIIDGYVEEYTLNHFGISINRNNMLTARIGINSIASSSLLDFPHIAIISRKRIDGEVKIYLDGLLVSTGNDFAPGASLNDSLELTIGAIHIPSDNPVSKGYFHGDIGEIVLLNEVIDTEARQYLEKYLSMKWRIDISGINAIVKPVLHLDASKIATVIKDDADNKISKWLDINGHNYDAVQADLDNQPIYRPDAYNGLGVVHFDSNYKNYLTLPRVVKDDFTVIVIYKTDTDLEISEYMPVSRDAFISIAGIDEPLSQTIWEELNNNGFIDDNGNVLSTFTPIEEGFTLDLNTTILDNARIEIESRIIAIVSESNDALRPVPQDAFTSIGGINETLSHALWNELKENGYIDGDGNVLPKFTLDTQDFSLVVNMENIIESAIINVLLTQNWFEGVGLFDGNCSGDPIDISKRDFGMLIGKEGTLIAGIGVIGESDYKIEANSSFGRMHIGIFTRKKDTGLVKLYVDKANPVQARFARNMSIKDSQRFTIGAVNTGGNYFKGDIAEIIVLDRVLSDDEIAKMQNYLSIKWGLDLNEALI
ncbi:MAG: hypothetical protein ACMUJM_17015 [bacterium]